MAGNWTYAAALGLAVLTAATPASAKDPSLGLWLTGEDLRATFAGEAVAGHYRGGRTFVERYFANGRIQYQEAGGRAQRGQWTLIGNNFCTFYSPPAGGACFLVVRQSGNCYAFYASATSLDAAKDNPPSSLQWTARVWLERAPSTCQGDAVS